MTLGTAFDFEAVHPHLRQLCNMLDRAQVFGIQNIGAVFILEGRHQLTGSGVLCQQKDVVRRRTHAQGRTIRGNLVGRRGPNVRIHRHKASAIVFLSCMIVVLPTTAVSTDPLIGIALTQVTAQQTAPGVGNAERTVDKGLQLQVGTLLAKFADFGQ